MGNLVESLLAGMGLIAGVMVFLMTLGNEEHSSGVMNGSSGNSTRTIHPEDRRMAA